MRTDGRVSFFWTGGHGPLRVWHISDLRFPRCAVLNGCDAHVRRLLPGRLRLKGAVEERLGGAPGLGRRLLQKPLQQRQKRLITGRQSRIPRRGYRVHLPVFVARGVRLGHAFPLCVGVS